MERLQGGKDSGEEVGSELEGLLHCGTWKVGTEKRWLENWCEIVKLRL